MGNVPTYRRLVRSLTKNSGGTITVSIPIEHTLELGWDKGDYVKVSLSDGKIVITETELQPLQKKRYASKPNKKGIGVQS